MICAAVRRTLMTWRQPTAHHHEKKNKTSSRLMDSFRHRVSVRIYIPLLATLLSKRSRNSERSVSPQYPAQALRMPWSSGVWRSTRSMLIRVSFRQVLQLGRNSTPTFCKTHSTKLQVSDHGPIVQMFRSQISTVVTSTNSSHLDVAIDHKTLQPQRRCCDMSITPGTSSHCNGSACRCIQLDFEARTVNSIT